VIEPGSDESLLFFQGPMSSLARNQVMHHGYLLTMAELRERFDDYAATFARHGIAITRAHLDAEPPSGNPAAG
jgi:hypothetical protein